MCAQLGLLVLARAGCRRHNVWGRWDDKLQRGAKKLHRPGINKACLGNTWPGESDFHSIYQFIIDRGTLHSRGWASPTYREVYIEWEDWWQRHPGRNVWASVNINGRSGAIGVGPRRTSLVHQGFRHLRSSCEIEGTLARGWVIKRVEFGRSYYISSTTAEVHPILIS